MKTLSIVAIIGAAIVGILIVFGTSQGNPQQPEIEKETQSITEVQEKEQPEIIPEATMSYSCSGSAGCFTDYVTRIVDGDTIHTATLKIRLSLTNTPESFEEGFQEATDFTTLFCPVGSKIIVDQDDLQKVDQYGRVLAKVLCGGKVLNSELLYNGHANILTQYCSTSEFSGETWAKRYGCGPYASEDPQKPYNCDPSYPDFCIASPPPDLNCKDIVQKRFSVIGSDPHRFDGDGDGIGCES